MFSSQEATGRTNECRRRSRASVAYNDPTRGVQQKRASDGKAEESFVPSTFPRILTLPVKLYATSTSSHAAHV